jgi:hypothetical protein
MGRVIEIIVVIICLPFYLLVWPFMYFGTRARLKKIRAQNCPHCGASLAGVGSKDLECCAVRPQLLPGAKVDWDRLPQTKITCAGCGKDICFDGKVRVTEPVIGE